jgi:hypothetical protein
VRNPRGLKLVLVASAAAIFALAATGGAVARDAAGNATFTVHMKLSGAVRGSLTFKVVELETPCLGGTGIGSAGVAGVPSPDGAHVKFNGVTLQYAINNAAYKGPGSYGTSDFANSSAAISADKASESDPFAPVNNAKSSEILAWNKNGSGSFTFRNWANGSGSRNIAGEFSWTCAG